MPAYQLVGYAVLLIAPILVVQSRRRRYRRAHFGLIGSAVTVLVLFGGAVVLAYPYGVLRWSASGELADRPESWLIAAVAPVVALAVAWWFRRDDQPWSWRVQLVRAGLLVLACTAALGTAELAGLPLWSVLGVAAGVSLAALVICVATWQLLDRTTATSMLTWALAPCAGAVAVGVLARTNGMPVPADPRTASYGELLVTMLLAGLLAFGATVAGTGSWRLLVGAGRFAAGRPTQRRPVRGEIWMADFPFEDRPGSKDRPVVVLRTGLFTAQVLKCTSQDQSHRPEYIRLPVQGWDPRAEHDSWLRLRVDRLPLRRFRRPCGPCPTAVWQRIADQDLPAARTGDSG